LPATFDRWSGPPWSLKRKPASRSHSASPPRSIGLRSPTRARSNRSAGDDVASLRRSGGVPDCGCPRSVTDQTARKGAARTTRSAGGRPRERYRLFPPRVNETIPDIAFLGDRDGGYGVGSDGVPVAPPGSGWCAMHRNGAVRPNAHGVRQQPLRTAARRGARRPLKKAAAWS
jgi:hypothetical protein